MVRNHIDQNLCCGPNSLPLFHGLIDQWLSFNVQTVRLFDDWLCLIEQIDQRPGPWQRFLNLPKLCFAETGRVPNKFNKPVFQHSFALLIATYGRCSLLSVWMWRFRRQNLLSATSRG